MGKVTRDTGQTSAGATCLTRVGSWRCHGRRPTHGRFAVGLLLTSALLSACGGLPDEPEEELQTRYPVFSGPKAMALESDLIVLGVVKDIQPGRTAGEGPGKIQYRDISIDVERVVLARHDPPDRVIVQEIGWANGKAAENSDLPWSVEGQRGYFFLQADVPGKFGFLGPQARVWLDEGKVLSGGSTGLNAVRRVNALTPKQLAEEIERDVAAVLEEGRVNPQGPAMGDGDLP